MKNMTSEANAVPLPVNKSVAPTQPWFDVKIFL